MANIDGRPRSRCVHGRGARAPMQRNRKKQSQGPSAGHHAVLSCCGGPTESPGCFRAYARMCWPGQPHADIQRAQAHVQYANYIYNYNRSGPLGAARGTPSTHTGFIKPRGVASGTTNATKQAARTTTTPPRKTHTLPRNARSTHCCRGTGGDTAGNDAARVRRGRPGQTARHRAESAQQKLQVQLARCGWGGSGVGGKWAEAPPQGQNPAHDPPRLPRPKLHWSPLAHPHALRPSPCTHQPATNHRSLPAFCQPCAPAPPFHPST